MPASYTIRPLHDEDSHTWTYILMDNDTRKAAIIDSVVENHERDLQLLKEMNVALEYIVETHIHADHITGAALLQEKTKAQTVLGAGARKYVSGADILLDDGKGLALGNTPLQALATPGHTDSCTSFYTGEAVFTGDALLIRGCGRTDFQQGNSTTLFNSVRGKLFTLPDDTIVYPAHNYKGMLYSTIGEEKLYNPRLKLENDLDTFIKIMKNLNLDSPKKIDIAVPANMELGRGYKVKRR